MLDATIIIKGEFTFNSKDIIDIYLYQWKFNE